MAIERINAGSPPILWSAVDEAFKKINDNFAELALSVGIGGVVDLSALASTVAPVDDNTYDLGKFNDRWRDLYVNQFVYVGAARIGSNGSVINLPAGSTIGDSGQLLDESYFKTIAVSGQNNIVADEATDTLTLSTGSGIDITTNSSTDTITFINTGVLSLTGSTGVSVNSSTGNITLSNTGVTSLSGTVGQIGVSASTGSVTLTNLGVVELTTDPGSGIGLSANKGIINISNLAPNIAQNVFRFVSVPGQTPIEADSIADTLTVSPGYGIILTTAALSDTLTITLDQNIDISGSVFSDDSTLLVDGVSGTIPGTLTGNWNNPGNVFGISGEGIDVSTGNSVLNVDDDGFGFSNSKDGALAFSLTDGGMIFNGSGSIGYTANQFAVTVSNNINIVADNINVNSAGVESNFYGSVFGDDSTTLVDAVDSKIVGPVDTTTVVASGSVESPTVLVSTIDSTDSSPITVTPAVVFNSDVTVENELIAGNIPGYVKLDTLKSVVAASTDFTDFQSRIAAL